jgi:hypothetical protein
MAMQACVEFNEHQYFDAAAALQCLSVLVDIVHCVGGRGYPLTNTSSVYVLPDCLICFYFNSIIYVSYHRLISIFTSPSYNYIG